MNFYFISTPASESPSARRDSLQLQQKSSADRAPAHMQLTYRKASQPSTGNPIDTASSAVPHTSLPTAPLHIIVSVALTEPRTGDHSDAGTDNDETADYFVFYKGGNNVWEIAPDDVLEKLHSKLGSSPHRDK